MNIPANIRAMRIGFRAPKVPQLGAVQFLVIGVIILLSGALAGVEIRKILERTAPERGPVISAQKTEGYDRADIESMNRLIRGSI